MATIRDGDSSLSIRRADATDTTVLDGTKGAEYPFWSFDSKSVGFFAEGKLKRVSSAGGAPKSFAPPLRGMAAPESR